MNTNPAPSSPPPPLPAGRAPHVPDAPARRKRPLRERSPILAHLRANLLKGVLTAIPLFITVYVITLFYGLVTHFTQIPADWMVDRLAPMLHISDATLASLKTVTTPILALLISLVIVYLLGLLGTFFVGRQILAQIDHIIGNLPLIKGIYGTTKQVITVFRSGSGAAGGGGSEHGFQRVILVEFPRLGTWTIAFVTNTVVDKATGRRLVCCFIPMTPNPTSGFFQMFPEDQVRNTDWSVDTGIKIVLSGGLLAPPHLESSTPPPARTTHPVDPKDLSSEP